MDPYRTSARPAPEPTRRPLRGPSELGVYVVLGIVLAACLGVKGTAPEHVVRVGVGLLFAITVGVGVAFVVRARNRPRT